MSYEPGAVPVYGTTHVGGKRSRPAPQESREQIIARNSFPGPDQNRHIDKFLAEMKKNG